ncbi:MAG: protein translocase SEC61 complex subunit gamma [Nitrosopumilus sp.]
MNPKKIVRDMVNTMKLAKKSDKEDYMQHMRLVLLGIAGVGTMGFIIQFVFSVATFGS